MLFPCSWVAPERVVFLNCLDAGPLRTASMAMGRYAERSDVVVRRRARVAEAVVYIKDDALDPERLEDLAVDLRAEILTTAVGRVDRLVTDPPPPGSRGTDLVELGAVVIQVALDTGLLTGLIQRVRDWRGRRDVRQLEIEIGDARLVLSDVSPEQQQVLIDHFVNVTSSREG
jgi:hypothetical protein